MTAGLAVPAAADDIVVTGRKVDPESLRAEALSFAKAVEAAPIDGQISRWNAPVCPSVGGLDPAVADIVAAKIRAVAADAGAKVGGEGCRANIVVTFTDNARGLVKAMIGKRSQLLRAASPTERGFIRDSDAPVRWWYAAATEGADGRPLLPESAALLAANAVPNSLPSNGDQSFVSTSSSSLIRSPFRSSINAVTVLVDAERATGAKLSDVAAYVAFVALARVKAPAPVPQAPSVLGLFGGTPSGLTAWDRAYLKALYSTAVDRTAETQRSRMTVAMVKALSRGPSDR